MVGERLAAAEAVVEQIVRVVGDVRPQGETVVREWLPYNRYTLC